MTQYQTKDYKCWQGCKEMDFCMLSVGMQNGAAAMESSMEILQKIKMELLYDPATHFWLFIQKNQIGILKRYEHSHVHCNSVHNS